MGRGVGGTGVSIVDFFLTADGGRQNKHCKECQKGHCLFHCQDVFLTLFRTPLSYKKKKRGAVHSSSDRGCRNDLIVRRVLTVHAICANRHTDSALSNRRFLHFYPQNEHNAS